MPKKILIAPLALLLAVWSVPCPALTHAPPKEEYHIGADEKLEITVHVWGEVVRPGEYRVSDTTDILELISKAGGPTEFSNLDKVVLSRGKKMSERVVEINLRRYLLQETPLGPLPTLRPGDVVIVPKSGWYKWRGALRIVSEVATIANAVYWLVRIAR